MSVARSNEIVIEVSAPELEELKWEKVFEKTYPEAYSYSGKATMETLIFLVDPLKLLTDWKEWARTGLVEEIEKKAKDEGMKQIKLEVYAGSQPLLWGVISYPAIKVISIHHASPVPVPLVILAIIIILALIAIILHEVKEIDWVGIGVGIGVGALILGGVLLLAIAKKERD